MLPDGNSHLHWGNCRWTDPAAAVCSSGPKLNTSPYQQEQSELGEDVTPAIITDNDGARKLGEIPASQTDLPTLPLHSTTRAGTDDRMESREVQRADY